MPKKPKAKVKLKSPVRRPTASNRKVRDAVAKVKRKRGGQISVYTDDLADLILMKVSCGDTLRGACRELGVEESTVRHWSINNVNGFAPRYARARELQAEAWCDDLATLHERHRNDPTLGRLELDSKKWLMSKNHVKRFGDKVTAVLEGGENPLRSVSVSVSAEEASRMYQDMVKEGKS